MISVSKSSYRAPGSSTIHATLSRRCIGAQRSSSLLSGQVNKYADHPEPTQNAQSCFKIGRDMISFDSAQVTSFNSGSLSNLNLGSALTKAYRTERKPEGLRQPIVVAGTTPILG